MPETKTVHFKKKLMKNGYLYVIQIPSEFRKGIPIDLSAEHDFTITYKLLDSPALSPIPSQGGLATIEKKESGGGQGVASGLPSFAPQPAPYRIVSAASSRQAAPKSPVENASRQPISNEKEVPLDTPPKPPLPREMTQAEIDKLREEQLRGVMERLLKKKTGQAPPPQRKPEPDPLKKIFEERRIAPIIEPEELPADKKGKSPLDEIEEELNRMY